MKKPKLLAPAGDVEKLKTAFDYGADAVYFGGKMYGLRANAANFDFDDMKKGAQYAHSLKRQVFVTINILAHNADIENMRSYIKDVIATGIDGIIAADPGIISIIRSVDKNIHITLSTQSSCTNYETANFWHRAGVNRVVLARELSKDEIADIIKKTPDALQIEIFGHGAMCIAYSGRCLLSNIMTARNANGGDCAQSCRWNYHLMEESRKGEYFPVFEDERGTYIFNSKDLCLIKHIDEIANMGVDVIKIEGRMKTEFYIATVVGAYRNAIDAYCDNPCDYKFNEEWLNELKKISYREYTTGFFNARADSTSQNYESSSYVRDWEFAGVIIDYNEKTKVATVQQRNKVITGAYIEIIGPYRDYIPHTIDQMRDKDGNIIQSAPNAMQIFCFNIDAPVKKGDFIRQKKNK